MDQIVDKFGTPLNVGDTALYQASDAYHPESMLVRIALVEPDGHIMFTGSFGTEWDLDNRFISVQDSPRLVAALIKQERVREEIKKHHETIVQPNPAPYAPIKDSLGESIKTGYVVRWVRRGFTYYGRVVRFVEDNRLLIQQLGNNELWNLVSTDVTISNPTSA